MEKLQAQMNAEMADKTLFETAKEAAYHYLDVCTEMDVFPSPKNINALENFETKLSEASTPGEEVLDLLKKYGSTATTVNMHPSYYGFVIGASLPICLSTKWLSDVWDQCSGLHVASPINAKLEEVCQHWLIDLLGLPNHSVAGFVSGTSMANFAALAAARYRLLKNMGWDVNEKGLRGSPKIRIIAHDQVHASIKKTLTLLGLGLHDVEWYPSDEQGRAAVDKMPVLDSTCLVLTQAGNVNTGAFDDFDTICKKANEVNAWVHVDGAFGLWAGASKSLKHHVTGYEKAHSWSVDGHKTLNTPYDNGIVICRDKDALICAMQATAEYLEYSDHRDPILYGPEMSKRSRAIELWSAMKYLGKSGIDALITGFHNRAMQLATELTTAGFDVINEVVFNQVLLSGDSDEIVDYIINYVQKSGKAWFSGTLYKGKKAIRISICSWMTSPENITELCSLIVEARAHFERVK